MCGRFVLATKPSAFIDRFRIIDRATDDEERFSFTELELGELADEAQLMDEDFASNYNIAPRWKIPAIARVDEQHVYLDLFKWGLLPPWAKDPKMGDRCFNARAETVAEKPMFRSAFKHSRCAVLADGYYEWKKTDEGKQPYFIHRADSEPMFFAGLCEPKTETATIITTAAEDEMADIHDRRPVFLTTDEVAEWLSPDLSREELEGVIQGSSIHGIESYPVSTEVNKAGMSDPSFIEKIDKGF